MATKKSKEDKLKEVINENAKNGRVLQIMAFGRGHVIVGFLPTMPNTDWVELLEAATIRRWNTNHGLAELTVGTSTAIPTLDFIPYALRIPRDSIHLMLVCDDAAQVKLLGLMGDAKLEMMKGNNE